MHNPQHSNNAHENAGVFNKHARLTSDWCSIYRKWCKQNSLIDFLAFVAFFNCA